MGLGRLQLWSSRNEENGQSPTAILKFALDAFQLGPNHGCLVPVSGRQVKARWSFVIGSESSWMEDMIHLNSFCAPSETNIFA